MESTKKTRHEFAPLIFITKQRLVFLEKFLIFLKLDFLNRIVAYGSTIRLSSVREW